MSNRDKDSEILAPRHQIAVLERHLDGDKVRFTRADRARLAAPLHRLVLRLARENGTWLGGLLHEYAHAA
ncbi:hypothetical protein ODJ79_42385 [Actinoplanes sp. KI2]|uniref:hypothetical protein n=1 Tax=Actinoplanes sp. KI2 TaxID=2983315 RepID=UPI0021D57F48|nr:hypothetical protein [Actinoplanes sp. KI2]MCU7730407.1 hypothetical protein [Actinoplanes sp. KI2]